MLEKNLINLTTDIVSVIASNNKIATADQVLRGKTGRLVIFGSLTRASISLNTWRQRQARTFEE